MLRGVLSGLCGVLALSCLWGSERALAQSSAGEGRRLTVLTSFSEAVSQEFAASFRHAYPGIDLSFIHKKTTAALNHLERGLTPQPDLIMASALDAFGWLAERDLLIPARAITQRSPPVIVPAIEPFCVPFARSGYGLMWHGDYLDLHGLDPPRQWEELLEPRFRGHIAMSSPSRSGTTHVIVESLLQSRGWVSGWSYWMELGGRLATVTARSFGVPLGVARERFGVGLMVDALAIPLTSVDANTGFAYPDPVVVLPVCAALVRGGTHLDEARHFLNFLVSEPGQRVLTNPLLGRYPINAEALGKPPEHPLERLEGRRRMDYDTALARRRYGLVNTLFDHLITYRLDRLRDFWTRYDRLAAREVSSDSDTVASVLARARKLATRVPFAAERLADEKLLAQFSRHQPGLMAGAVQRAEEAAWRKRLDADLVAANTLLDALARELESPLADGQAPP